MKTKKQTFWITVANFLAITTLLFIGCQKRMYPPINTSNSLIENAHKWYANSIVKPEEKRIASDTVFTQTGKNINKIGRMEKLGKFIDWDRANVFSYNRISYVIARVNESIRPFSNKAFEAARCLVFYKDSSGSMQLIIIEMLGKKNDSLPENIKNLANEAFSNRYFNKDNRIGNVNASILFYNKNYIHENSFQISDGYWHKAGIMIKSVRASKMTN